MGQAFCWCKAAWCYYIQWLSVSWGFGPLALNFKLQLVGEKWWDDAGIHSYYCEGTKRQKLLLLSNILITNVNLTELPRAWMDVKDTYEILLKEMGKCGVSKLKGPKFLLGKVSPLCFFLACTWKLRFVWLWKQWFHKPECAHEQMSRANQITKCLIPWAYSNESVCGQTWLLPPGSKPHKEWLFS